MWRETSPGYYTPLAAFLSPGLWSSLISCWGHGEWFWELLRKVLCVSRKKEQVGRPQTDLRKENLPKDIKIKLESGFILRTRKKGQGIYFSLAPSQLCLLSLQLWTALGLPLCHSWDCLQRAVQSARSPWEGDPLCMLISSAPWRRESAVSTAPLPLPRRVSMQSRIHIQVGGWGSG